MRQILAGFIIALSVAACDRSPTAADLSREPHIPPAPVASISDPTWTPNPYIFYESHERRLNEQHRITFHLSLRYLTNER